jgi:hypothetical protein
MVNPEVDCRPSMAKTTVMHATFLVWLIFAAPYQTNRKWNLKLWFDWSHDHLGWTIRPWRWVHWSDESRFLLRPTDGRARVWCLSSMNIGLSNGGLRVERAHCHGIFGLSDYHQERTSPTYSQRKNRRGVFQNFTINAVDILVIDFYTLHLRTIDAFKSS